jgi:S-adenosyl-L-methionine hydrolase (adenosine-forming)
VVHRVILSRAPHARIVDLTHGIPPQDVRAGALALWRAVPYLAPCVVMAVVDPGVGTGRRAVAIETDTDSPPLLLLGPDNGLLVPAANAAGGIARVVELEHPDCRPRSDSPPAIGATFAGRDVFAPAAGQLCNGVDIESLGSIVDPAGLEGGPIELVSPGGPSVVAEVLWVDRFGNAQLNVEHFQAPGPGGEKDYLVVEVPGADPIGARRVTAYAELGEGELGLVLDSSGLLSLCVFRGRAADLLGIRPGDRVALRATSTAPVPFGHGPGQAHP